ncbi:MAG: 50S ribosomal protein L35 [Candidatus Omnitrophica bacterium]|nr:50S ribosomal protein L35 [Candidatus Omnitrophota bacterium]
MPKLKTRKSVAKRFRMTKHGKIKRNKAFRGHLRGSKSASRKMKLSKPDLVSLSDANAIKRMLPYG